MKKENIALLVVSAVLVIIFIYSLFFSTPTYTVTFNTDGGSKVASVKVKRNKEVEVPTTPTKDGYKFVSWQYKGMDYDFSTPVTQDMEIVATWEEDEEETTTKKTTTTTKKSSKKKTSKKSN